MTVSTFDRTWISENCILLQACLFHFEKGEIVIYQTFKFKVGLCIKEQLLKKGQIEKKISWILDIITNVALMLKQKSYIKT